MRKTKLLTVSSVSLLCCLLTPWRALRTFAEDKAPAAIPAFTRARNVSYGGKDDTALTMDVFTPKTPNGVAVIWVVCGGWFSTVNALENFVSPKVPASPINVLLERGYTVFAVVLRSQPKFTIPEMLRDLQRATRFIRFHATDYRIDPQRIGITGSSAGGHLSLMQGMAGDLGDPQAADPLEQMSSRVQAVACFFPPTDFLNYGKPGENALGRGILQKFAPAFAFQQLDSKGGRVGPITDEQKILGIGRQISPITHVTADDPPTLIVHGDHDPVVPIQQSETILAKLKKVGVPTELVVKKGAGHGSSLKEDMPVIAGWFDRQLKKN